jgi:hypothetical protein
MKLKLVILKTTILKLLFLIFFVNPAFSQKNTLESLMQKYKAQKAVFTIQSNDDLEKAEFSIRFESPEGNNVSEQVDNFVLKKLTKDQYVPISLLDATKKFFKKNDDSESSQKNIILVTKPMKNGELSPDDARYASYLESTKGVKVVIFLLPADESTASESPLVISGEDFKKIEDPNILEKTGGYLAEGNKNNDVKDIIEHESFAKEQWRKFKSIPGKPTWTAFNVSIWRTLINLTATSALFLYQSDVISPERFFAYVGVGLGFSFFFGVFNQTVLNWIEFWMDFTERGVEKLFKLSRLKNWLKKNTNIIAKDKSSTEAMMTLGERAGFLKRTKITLAKGTYEVARFISRRGDILIAFPTLGIATTFFVRYALGEVGQTASVLTFAGFAMLVKNIIWGSIFGGPVNQTLINLRARGRFSKKAVMRYSSLEELKMQFGKVGDFGLQTVFYVGQAFIGTALWATLWTTELLFPKPEVIKLSPEEAKNLEEIRDKLKQKTAIEDEFLDEPLERNYLNQASLSQVSSSEADLVPSSEINNELSPSLYRVNAYLELSLDPSNSLESKKISILRAEELLSGLDYKLFDLDSDKETWSDLNEKIASQKSILWPDKYKFNESLLRSSVLEFLGQGFDYLGTEELVQEFYRASNWMEAKAEAIIQSYYYAVEQSEQSSSAKKEDYLYMSLLFEYYIKEGSARNISVDLEDFRLVLRRNFDFRLGQQLKLVDVNSTMYRPIKEQSVKNINRGRTLRVR